MLNATGVLAHIGNETKLSGLVLKHSCVIQFQIQYDTNAQLPLSWFRGVGVIELNPVTL